MQNDKISPDCLRDALIAGCLRLIDSRNMLNELNVFPVPDGDTGTNMAATAAEVAYALEGIDPTSVPQVLRVASKAAIIGARGNSGAILAQFLTSFTERVTEVAQPLQLGLIVDACTVGCYGARAAVANPVEGTILSVMVKWASALEGAQSGGLESCWHNALVEARHALNYTQHQLPELSEAGVVDAGGLGFVAILEGIAQFLKTGTRDSFAQHNPHLDLAEVAHGSFDSSAEHFRYCTECLISGEALDLVGVKRALQDVGDSLVVAGNHQFMRVHIHTDDAQAIFNRLAQFGELSQQKVDDMKAQVASRPHHQDPNWITIITDSCCDAPDEFLLEQQVAVVPLRMVIEDETFLDKTTIHPTAFYERLPQLKALPQTSQPPNGDYQRAYALAADRGGFALSIHMSQAISGTYQAAVLAASKASLKVRCVDSQSVSVGLGLIVRALSHDRSQGVPLDQLVERAKSYISQTKTMLLPQTVSYMVKGGRLKASVGRFIQLTGLLPILASKQGKIALGGMTIRGRWGLWLAAKWISWQLRRKGPVYLAVAHANDREKAEWFCELIKGQCHVKDAYITELSPVLGVYTGPQALAIAYRLAP